MGNEAYFGFDLGHGETAVSLSQSSARVEARSLQLTRGGAKVMPTVVARGPDNAIMVGDSALLSAKARDRRAAFKHPDVHRPDVREPIIQFVQGVLAEMAACGSTIDGNLVFGHPSGWTEEQVSRYRSLLSEATGRSPMMVPEARAAFLPLKSTGELGTMELAQGRIVVVDMGSSTTDFALVQGVSNPTDLGNPGGIQLGAGLIELALFHQCLADLPGETRRRVEGFLSENLSEMVHVVVAFRQAKEAFFTKERTYRETGSGPKPDLDLLEAQLDVSWSPRITGALMDRCLDTPLDELGVIRDLFGREISIRRSWRGEFFAHVQYALNRLDGPPTIMVLTGGAAKMGWVFDEVRAHFRSCRILRTAEPEHTIASGLALHGSAYAKSAEIRAEIDALVQSTAVEDVIVDAWSDGVERLVAPLVDGFVDRFVIPALIAWRKGEVSTLDGIGERGGELARTWAESRDGAAQLGEAAAKWYEETIAPAVNARVREISAKYPDIPSDAVEIPSGALRVDLATANAHAGVSADMILGDVDMALNGILVVVSSIVAMTLFGAGHAVLLATGPGAVVAAAVVGAVALILGKEDALKRVKSANLPVLARKFLTEDFLSKQVRKKRVTIEADVRKALVSNLQANEEAKRRIATEVSSLIDASLSRRVREASAHLI